MNNTVLVEMDAAVYEELTKTLNNAEKTTETLRILNDMLLLVQSAIMTDAPLSVKDNEIHIEGKSISHVLAYLKEKENAK